MRETGLLNRTLLILVVCFPLFTFSQAPEKIIFDTDMGSDCDDVGALALLHQYVSEGKAEIVAEVYSSGVVPYGAGVIDAINRFFGRSDIPLGASHGNEVGDPVDKMLAEQMISDTSRYGNRIVTNTDAPEQVGLLRKVLASQPDGEVTYVTIGHTEALASLLNSGPDQYSPLSGEDLVEKKVQRWVALGALNAGNERGDLVKDWNFFFNGTADYTRTCLEKFPNEVYFIDGGSDVMTGQGLQHLGKGNILYDAYVSWLDNVFDRTLEDQRSSWDLLAVYFAVEGKGSYLSDRGPGYLEFSSEKGCRWIQTEPRGNQYLISQREGIDEAFSEYLNEKLAMIEKDY